MIETDDPIKTLERELVRVAGAVHAPSRRVRRRRMAVVAVAIAAVSVAVVVIVLSGGRGVGAPSIADAAYAQLTPHDGVLVLGLETRQRIASRTSQDRATQWSTMTAGPANAVRTRVTVLNLRTGRIITVVDSAQSNRDYQSYNLATNTLTTARFCPGTQIAVTDAATDPVKAIRAQLARHLLRSAGTTTFDGRRAARLISTIAITGVRKPQPIAEVLVDPATGAPLAFIQRPVDHSKSGQASIVTKITSRVVLAPTPTNLALLHLPEHPGARQVTIPIGQCNPTTHP